VQAYEFELADIIPEQKLNFIWRCSTAKDYISRVKFLFAGMVLIKETGIK
jgi:hypothetical protein